MHIEVIEQFAIRSILSHNKIILKSIDILNPVTQMNQKFYLIKQSTITERIENGHDMKMDFDCKNGRKCFNNLSDNIDFVLCNP